MPHSFDRHDPISTNPYIIKGIHALLIQGFSKFCCTSLYVHSSFAIILMGKRELSLSSWYLVMVVWLFLTVPWVCLWFVILVFLIKLTYYFCYHKYTRSRPLTFMFARSVNRYYILKDFLNESLRSNPLFQKP